MSDLKLGEVLKFLLNRTYVSFMPYREAFLNHEYKVFQRISFSSQKGTARPQKIWADKGLSR